MDLTTPRFGMFSLFLLAVVFSLLAPLYWTHVEAPAADARSGAYENQETYGHLLPSIHYGYTRWRAGDLPLWSPQIYCGVPYFSNPVHGLLQPLNAIFLFTQALPGLALHAFLGLFLMAMFTAVYLRALGAAYVPAAIGGMVYAFSGASAAAMSRPELLAVLTWTPLLYWMVYAYTESGRRRWIVPGGLGIAALLLSGAPLFGGLMAGSAFFYGLARAVAPGRAAAIGRLVPVRGLLAMGLLGILYAAVQWVPFAAWVFALDDPRAALVAWKGAGYLPGRAGEVPGALLGWSGAALPGMLNFGAIALMLLPAAILHRQRRLDVIYFLCASPVWIGLAVWGYGGVHGEEFWLMLVYPALMGVAVLAGLGSDRALLAGRDPRSPLIWGSGALVLAAAAVLLVSGNAAIRGPVALAALALLPFFILRVKLLGTVCGICVAFLLFADLRNANTTIYQHPYAGDHDWLRSSVPAIKEAEALALGERVLVVPTSRETVLPSNVGWLQPVENAGGAYWPLTSAQAHWWSRLGTHFSTGGTPRDGETGADSPFYPELLNYMGVRVVIAEQNYPWMDQSGPEVRLRLQFLETMGRLSLWKNESAYPRVRWVPHWEAVTGIEDAMNRLLAPSFSGGSTCVVEESGGGVETLRAALPPGTPDDSPAAAAGGAAILTRERAETLDISVTAPLPGVLLVADSYAAGWKAYVDGESVPILRVNGLFRGVYLPAGDHEVIFTYAPAGVIIGVLLSATGLVLSLLWLLILGVKRLRSPRGRVESAAASETPRPDGIQEFRR